MPRIETVEALAGVWGRAFLSERPLETLAQRDITLADDLRRRLELPQRKRMPPEVRARLLAHLGKAGVSRVRFAVNALALPPVSAELPENEWDVIVGIGVELVNQTLAGLYETRTWPHELTRSNARALFPLDELREFSDDVPAGDDVEIGTLHLVSPPVAAVGAGGRLFVEQPFVLDLESIADGPEMITTLAGVLRPVLQPLAEPDDDQLIIQIGAPLAGLAEVGQSELEIDSASPVQPRSAGALDTLEARVMERVNIGLLTRRVSISPTLTVPLGPVGGEVLLRIQRAEVRTSASPTPGALVVGVLIGTDPNPAPGTGSTQLLRLAPFSTEIANVSVRLHEALLNKLAKEAVRSGAVELPDPSGGPGDLDFTLDLEINDIAIDLRPLNAVEVTLDAKFVDFCGPGPFNFIDLDFDLTGAAQVAVFDERLRVIAPEDVSIDYDNSDALACTISSLIDAATVVFGIEVIADIVIFVVIDLVVEGVEPVGIQRRGVFSIGQPIPGTELAPEVEIVQAIVEDETLELLGSLTLSQDDDHIFINLRVVSRRPGPFRLGPPISGATVEVVDQDAPQLLGGELGIPKEGTTTEIRGRFLEIRTVEVIEPTTDEVLATGTSDANGLARFVIDRRSFGGRIRITKTRERIEADPTPQTTVSEFPIIETRPDLFFRVTLPDGRVFDSRQPGGGLVFSANASDRRLGSPEAPLVLALATDVLEPGDVVL